MCTRAARSTCTNYIYDCRANHYTAPTRTKKKDNYANQQSTRKRQRSSPSTTESVKTTNSTQLFPPTVSTKRTPSRQKIGQLFKQKKIANKTIISTVLKTVQQNPEDPESNLKLLSCSPDLCFHTQYTVFPNCNETTVTVR